MLPPAARGDGEQQALRIELEALDGFAAQAADDGPLPLDVVRAAFGQALQEPSPHQPFLGGGVTFAGMVPLPTVLFRAICMLGMDAEAYPRRHLTSDYIRLASEPDRAGSHFDQRSLPAEHAFATTSHPYAHE